MGDSIRPNFVLIRPWFFTHLGLTTRDSLSDLSVIWCIKSVAHFHSAHIIMKYMVIRHLNDPKGASRWPNATRTLSPLFNTTCLEYHTYSPIKYHCVWIVSVVSGFSVRMLFNAIETSKVHETKIIVVGYGSPSLTFNWTWNRWHSFGRPWKHFALNYGFAPAFIANPGQKTTGQKTTGQKTTKNANPRLKTTRTKDHPDKRPPSWFFYGEILSHLTVYSFIREQVKKWQKWRCLSLLL